MGQSNETRPRIQLPKDALSRINLGQAFAEYDRILLKPGVFVNTPALEAAIDPNRSKCFFVGRRGTGKTAITYHLSHKFRHAFQLHPQGLTLGVLPSQSSLFRDTRQRPFKSLVAAFKRSLVDEALRECLAKGIVGKAALSSGLPMEYKLIVDFDFDQRLLDLFERVAAPLATKNDGGWLEEMSQSKVIVNDALVFAEEKGLQAIMMIDRIDEAWDGSDLAVVSLMALMHACVELSSMNTRMRPLLFLRENIFERVRQLDNEFARLETCVVSLDWTRELLLELIERRLGLPFNTKPPLGGPMWECFFETSDGISSRDAVFEYCQLRPRDVLTYCGFGIEAAQARRSARVTLECLTSARKRFSDSRFKDMVDEYSENYPQLSVILSRFYGLGKVYTLPGIEALIKLFLVDPEVARCCDKWFYSYTTPEGFVSLLYNIGFVGVDSGSGPTFRSLGVKDPVLPPIGPRTMFRVHPMYVDALNLQDAIMPVLDAGVSLKSEGIIEDLPGAISLVDYHVSLDRLTEELKTLPCGAGEARRFEDIVGEMIRLCFYSVLNNVEAQSRDIGGTVVRDWVAANVAQSGFWEMVRSQYSATQAVWECKNVKKLHADDFQQAAYYLGGATGRLVLVAFRGDEVEGRYYEHIRKIHDQKRGLVLLLPEKDLLVCLRQARNGRLKESHIQEIFDRTVRRIS